MMHITNITVDSLTKSKNFIDFAKSVREFCNFMENYVPENNTAFLRLTQTHLQNLYLTGQQLQFVDLIHNVTFDDPVSKNDLENISKFIADRLGKNRYYWHVFDPTNVGDTEAVCGDLVDDLADIYKELKNALLLFDTEKLAEIETALWNFKWGFDNHWGDHCINATYALHYFIQRPS